MIKVKIKALNSDAIVPAYQTQGAAGFDLHAAESVVLDHRQATAVGTGLAFEIPDGYELQIRSRSGNSLKGLVVANAPGTIDSDYRGEVKCIMRHQGQHGEWAITKGDRIAQAVLARVERAGFEVANDLGETERGDGGFGSTGK